MRILSHRGYWKTPAEKNSGTAFERSFRLGFGTETDLRDLDGQVVISHDMARSGAMDASAFFSLYAAAAGDRLPLALNIKADGLWNPVAELLKSAQTPDSFVFDMSIPDTLGYLERGIPVFVRQSEYEPEPALYDRAAGVWMDCFLSDWIEDSHVARHLANGKRVCIVSPELHKRPHESWWRRFSAGASSRDRNVMLCTDLPEQAREAFHED